MTKTKENSFTYQLAKPTDVEQIVTLFKLCLGTAGGAPTMAFGIGNTIKILPEYRLLF